MTDHPHLRVTVDDSRQVLTVTLANAEERNAQTPSLWRALAAAGEAVGDDIRVVVLRAEGTSFSAGLHRGMLSPAGMPGEPHLVATATSAPADTAEMIAGFQRAFRVWQEMPQVVVAAVHGHAIGLRPLDEVQQALLEPGAIDHEQVGLPHRGRLLCRSLEVVGIRADRHDRGHVGRTRHDLGHDMAEDVRGHHHARSPAARRRTPARGRSTRGRWSSRR